MFYIKFTTGNAAFGDADDGSEAGPEIARILRAIAVRCDNGDTHGRCVDYNGNKVGEWEFNPTEN